MKSAGIEFLRRCAMAGAGFITLGSTWLFGAMAAQPPSVSPPGGVFTSNVTVVLSTANGEVRFTLDGSLPRTNSLLYTTPLLVTNSCLLRTRAFARGQPAGELAVATFTLLETNLTDFSSSLPLVIIQTFGDPIQPETNVLVSMRCIDGDATRRAAPGGPAQFDRRAAVKVRGYTSQRYPKKSFAVELVDASGDQAPAPLLGMPKDSDWNLSAPYFDKSLLRDALACAMSDEMGHYASRTRFVEVFVNDSAGRLSRAHYAGVYVLEEKIKRAAHRVSVHKLSPEDGAEPAITGGYIFKKDHLEEMDHDGVPVPSTNATATATTTNRPGRVGYPTGPGGFPADPAGFLPPHENIVTLASIVTTTNVFLVTNVVAATNVLPITSVASATQILTVTNVTLLTNILTATNVVINRSIREVTNVLTLTRAAPVTNIVSITNVAPFPEVARFTNVTVFTNLATFTNVASVTNSVAATNLVSITNLASATHLTSVTNVSAVTNTAQSTTVELTARLALATNVTSITNYLTVTNPIVAVTNTLPATNVVPARLVEKGQGFVTIRTNAFSFVEPKASRITPVQRAWLSNHVNRFEQALHGPDFRNPTNGYAAFIDPDSFIDHHLMVEATRNIDGFRFSTFFVKDRGGRIRMEPIWDWNLNLGNAGRRQGDQFQHWYWPQLDDRQYSWFRRLFEDPDFGQRYVDRWAELRASLFATSNLWVRVDAMAAALKEPAARNFERWPILGQSVATEPFTAKTYDEEILYLKSGMSNRLAWINAQFVPPPRLQPAETEVAAGATLVLTSAMGRIYFTLDGRDPRQSGGAVSSSARTGDQPLTVTNELRIFARVQQDQRWSSPTRARVGVRPSQSSSR